MDDLRQDTRDLLTLDRPHPTEADLADDDRENRTRRYGRWCRRIGLTTIIGAFGTSLAVALLSEHRAFNQPAAQALANLALCAILVAGSIVASAGFQERRERPLRAMMRHMLAAEEQRCTEHATQSRQIARLQERAEASISDSAGQIQAALFGLQSQVAQVADYGKGVADGLKLGRQGAGLDDLDRMPSIGPDDLNGFNRLG